jgi:hypothetical protein
MRRPVAIVLVLVMTAACHHGPVRSLRDLCTLADLPATTPAEITALKQQSSDRLESHRGTAFPNTGRNKRIFKAVVLLQAAASEAEFDNKASGSLKSLLPLLHSGQPTIIPTVSDAQSDLRSACSG